MLERTDARGKEVLEPIRFVLVPHSRYFATLHVREEEVFGNVFTVPMTIQV